MIGTTDALAEDVLAGLRATAEERAAVRGDPARAPPAIETRLARRRGVARHREPAAREPDAAAGRARAPRAARGAPRDAHRRADRGGPAARPDAGAARVPRARAAGHGVERLVRSAPDGRRRHDRRPVPAWFGAWCRSGRGAPLKGVAKSRPTWKELTCDTLESSCWDCRLPPRNRPVLRCAALGREPALGVQGRSRGRRRDTAAPGLAAALAGAGRAAERLPDPGGARPRGAAGWPRAPDMGRVRAAIHVAYAGPALESSRRYYWRVRVWDGDGKPSAWSATGSMGLLRPRRESSRDRSRLGRRQDVGAIPDAAPRVPPEAVPRSARAYVTSRGLYELEINGRRVGDEVFTPGWTSPASASSTRPTT